MGAGIGSCPFSFCTGLPQFFHFLWKDMCPGMGLKSLQCSRRKEYLLADHPSLGNIAGIVGGLCVQE